ncbi:hypothetical protein [Flavobacterium sp.]|uniref:hypothetical protein n=1 Tax=Flavobacterium sp. TaxID=239 RepID=UPI0025C31F95|nr:hypothetical protein [Flavobacterium sp.]
MSTFIPLLLSILFVGYLAYLGFVKKQLRQNVAGFVMPGVFFLCVWAVFYYLLMH